MAVHVVWLKRDLRCRDHRPLAEAIARAQADGGQVLPVYFKEPTLWQAEDASPRHWRFVAESLAALRKELPVAVREAEVLPQLQRLHRQQTIAGLYAHEETTNDLAYQRDRQVRAWAKANQIPFLELPQGGVVRRLQSRDGWARNWEKRMAEPVTPAVTAEQLRYPAEIGLGEIPDFPPNSTAPNSSCQAGGEAEAWRTLEGFLEQRGTHYFQKLSSPLTAFAACSRLSPHLAFGTISMREVTQTTRRKAAELAAAIEAGQAVDYAPQWRRSLQGFASRLHWRCHFMQKLEDEPALEFENLVRSFDGMREPYWNDDSFHAWAEGRTGYPLVDACMRALRATGWMNFRMRAMLMAFSSYHLWLHWRRPAIHLARLFTDYEPGIHYSQAQMQSGTTGINTLRIYNPTKQALDQDPEGTFIRQWVPELAEVETAFIHTPWLRPQPVAGYPQPIVVHETAYALARQRMGEFRRRPGFREEAQAIQRKHGSRNRPAARKRAAAKRAAKTTAGRRTRKAPLTQLALPLEG